ncbi:uncharacterized protein LOC112055344 isoform X2 [Bicyclus anynana]|uniref:Uncharacterized protein LOC112055344 isoform X2 n=1 Tax=Bicyclus anynana TaxID=110368 RepID=A0A6J1NU10_BICAN|nr:uncharacterized protein LOC112055344 isoform X2 [Bicyclus anynana]
MDNTEVLNTRRLEQRSYRQLQQMAKSLDLPSNFKKIYLIELIVAKKLKTDYDVENIIDRVRQERLNKSKAKKNYQSAKIKFPQCHVTMHKISESNNSVSPPITVTPKRSNMEYSSEIVQKALVPINPKRNILRNMVENLDIDTTVNTKSDRVLRSYNMKSLKPNYALINNNIHELKTQCCSPERKINIITTRNFSQFNVKTKSMVKKRTKRLSDSSPFSTQQIMDLLRPAMPTRRQRAISGIYPLNCNENVPSQTTQQSVCLRQTDGSFTKFNALIQKCNIKLNNSNYRIKNQNVNIQEVIHTSDLSMENRYLYQKQYRNTASVLKSKDASCNTKITITHGSKKNYAPMNVQPYRNITSELRLQRKWDCQKLPNINEAFNFNTRDPRTRSKPKYVDVATETDSVPGVPAYSNSATVTSSLERLYNIKTITTQSNTEEGQKPAQTHLVYACRTCPTAALFPSTVPAGDALNVPSLMFDTNQYMYDLDTRFDDVPQLQPTSPTDTADFSTSSTLDTDSSVFFDMEDALDIISQDGDFMERFGMNTQSQCVICTWAGPTITLDCHIRKEHADSIHKQCKNEWNMTYTLGSLVQSRAWLHRVIEHDSLLYSLSAKYEPGCIKTMISFLSLVLEPTVKVATITLYNKMTGEPFSWTGQILALPAKVPYEIDDTGCFTVDITKLDLLSNNQLPIGAKVDQIKVDQLPSANLKLMNKEFVNEFQNKIVDDESSLNDIHVIVFIRIYDI